MRRSIGKTNCRQGKELSGVLGGQYHAGLGRVIVLDLNGLFPPGVFAGSFRHQMKK